MNIRNFHMVPCATCGEDTLHIAMACRTCGTVTESNFEARQRARKRRMARINRLGFNPNWQEQRDAARAKKRANAALPAARFARPKFTTSVFGSGRERTSTK
jgi:hypothetical protein